MSMEIEQTHTPNCAKQQVADGRHPYVSCGRLGTYMHTQALQDTCLLHGCSLILHRDPSQMWLCILTPANNNISGLAQS